jgi:hypothetical protein
VAVISNGTAILGLGDLGALASKPVMEGKSVLFKRFGDVDSIDIEISSKDADEIITVVKNIGVTFGGINLEDIKSPECFRIETELQELLDIPVFHDDQHGTAIICAAGLINACHITGKKIEDVKVVLNGPGAAGIASLELIKAMGVKPDNVIAVDSKGVLYRGRTEGMNQWKSAHAVDTPLRTLAEAVVGADVLLGLSAKGAFTPAMIASMAPNPVIFAMANPDPEITPEEVHAHPQGRDHGHRPQRLSQSGQQRPGLSLHLPRRPGRAGPPGQSRDEDRLRQRPGHAGPRGRARRGRRRLSRPPAEVRPAVHHPLGLRPAADLVRAAVRRPGGDGHRRGPQADRRHGRLPRQPGPAPGSHRRLPAEDQRRRPGQPQDASCSPKARTPR